MSTIYEICRTGASAEVGDVVTAAQAWCAAKNSSTPASEVDRLGQRLYEAVRAMERAHDLNEQAIREFKADKSPREVVAPRADGLDER